MLRTGNRELWQSGFSLAEVTVAMGITALLVGSLVNGYIIAAKRAEWTAMSEAAQSVARQKLEQVRAARWDLTANPPIDELTATNFLPEVVQLIYTALGSTNPIYCTNFTTIRQVSTSPPLKFIRTDCVWQSPSERVHTNTLMLYRSPDP